MEKKKKSVKADIHGINAAGSFSSPDVVETKLVLRIKPT